MNEKNYKTYKKPVTKATQEYGYYSKVLQKPFDSIEELKEAELQHFAAIKAKENKAAAKKADAAKVEESFKALNQARKDYKNNLLKLAEMYQADLKKLKENFEADQARVKAALADAEASYSAQLKAFTDKYPEGYHLTLKDGDFETTISSQSTTTAKNTKAAEEAAKVFDLFNWVFGF